MADVLLSTITGSNVIKSIQRGTHALTSGSGTIDSVAISSVNTGKAFVQSSFFSTSTTAVVAAVALTSSTSLTVSGYSTSGGTVVWQVVEYY